MPEFEKLRELTALERRQLTFITTDNCTAACPHCLMNCKPGKKHYLTFEQMKSAIDSFRARENLIVVVFTGGEPTLLGEELLKAIRYCVSLNVITRIVTNAHWASTPERAKKMLTVLKDAGLAEINMSMDDFHAPYVPIENVRNAWNATKGMGFEAVIIANCHGEGDTITPEYIQEFMGEKIVTRDADHRFTPNPEEKRTEDGTLYFISEGRLQKLGRAGDAIQGEDKYFKRNGDLLRGGCGTVLAQPCVSYTNHVWGCCGMQGEGKPLLDLGDLNKSSFDEIMDRAEDSVLVNALHYIGPFGLWELACQLDPSINTDKVMNTPCEVCEELVGNEKAVAILRKNIPALALAIRQIKKKLKEDGDEGGAATTDTQTC